MNLRYIKTMIVPAIIISVCFSTGLTAGSPVDFSINYTSASVTERETTGNNKWKSTPASQHLERTLKEEFMEQASTAVLAAKISGDTIAFHSAKKMLIPASTMKAVTTGVAIHSCGADFIFETKLAYNGKITDGTLEGDLYIIGGGDPTLGSRDSIAIPVEKLFAKWKNIISKAGIKRINGHIIGDDRYFDRYAEVGSWQWNDTGTYYGTGVSGLTFHENMQNINISPGEAPGRPLKISIGYPELPWMDYIFSCYTGKEGTGNSLYLYTSPFAPTGEMRGSFAMGRKTKTEQVSNKFPAYTCAWHFRKYLIESGLECQGDAADLGRVFGIGESETVPQDSLHIIGSTFSPTLKRIAFETNHESNNLYAETLFKSTGKEYCGTGSYDSARTAMKGILSELGIDTSYGCNIEDGSGLSRQNCISPDFMCRFLKAMTNSPGFEDYIETFPSPGGNGTLTYIMKKYPQEVTGRIRMKSGSMNGVRCYCGYVIPAEGSKDDIIVFSIMTNNYFGSISKLQGFLDRLIYLIACEN